MSADATRASPRASREHAVEPAAPAAGRLVLVRVDRVDHGRRHLVAIPGDDPERRIEVGRVLVTAEGLVRLVSTAPVVAERLVVGVPDLHQLLRPDRSDLDPLRHRQDGRQVVLEAGARHVEEPADWFVARPAGNRVGALVAALGEGAQDARPTRVVGARQRSLLAFAVRKHRGADPALPPRRIHGTARAVLANAIVGVDPVASGEADHPAIDLGDAEVTGRVELLGGVREVGGLFANRLAVAEAVGLPLFVLDADHLRQIRLARVRPHDEARSLGRRSGRIGLHVSPSVGWHQPTRLSLPVRFA